MIFRIHKYAKEAAKKEEISMEYQTNSIGFSNIRVMYKARGALISITLIDVMINIGVAKPNPCITLLHVIPIVISGNEKTNTLK